MIHKIYSVNILFRFSLYDAVINNLDSALSLNLDHVHLKE